MPKLAWTEPQPSQPLASALQQQKCCLVTHQQLELVLEALSESKMKEHKEIALDLAQLPRGSFPEKLTSAKRAPYQAKQYSNENLGFDRYEVPPGSVLLLSGPR